ncbi:MAG: DNA internalization-related competence protein ComEC/Rec2 [Acidaminococcus sp.]|jgi:competence protein ComEC|nr:DNA internalization-related competence protein ComEC/Rec2 [Acidaminococcus sp.]MCI2099538.1 DNA internalization-related competence protein ComEC/Rec2 [Acidaminococcus sp.]MCI2113623.1 DNA internalization-related competence protein ComEC/Rec2 [Acidaminococcus sp.]MCI2115706.1 DNA internalization-related competence protein ComEC/Rec2 [Acidaminococcus sp.]
MTPLFGAGLFYALGIFAGIYLRIGLIYWILLLTLAAAALCFCFYVRKDRKMLIACFCLSFFFLGGIVPRLRESAPRQMRPYFGKKITVTGRIVPGSYMYDSDTRYAAFLLDTSHGKIRVNLLKAAAWSIPYGKVQVQGTLLEPSGFYNPGMPPPEAKAASAGIGGMIRTEGWLAKKIPSKLTLWERIHDWGMACRKPLRKAVPETDRAILEGMLFGGQQGMPPQTVRIFSECGLSHMLSVSGSHVALLLGIFFFLFKVGRMPKPLMAVLVCAGLIAYAVICGLRAPVCRAAMLGCGAAWGQVLRRRAGGTSFLGLAGLVLLTVNPYWILDLGMQLSFGAAAGLMLCRKPIAGRLCRFMPEKLAAAFSVTLSAQVLTMPILIRNFHLLSLTSLLANLLITPLLGLCLVGTMLGTVISLVSTAAGQIVLALVAQLSGAAMWGAEKLAAIPGGLWITGQPAFWALPCYGILLFLFFYPYFGPFTDRKYRQRILAAALLGLAAAFLWPHFRPQPFTVYFLDVGQGDCALVVTPERETILIDTGGLPGRFDTGERILVPVLRGLGFSHVDVLLLSHGHHDHAGGAAGVAACMPIKKILLPNEPPSPDVERLLRQLSYNDRSCSVETMRPHSTLHLNGAKLTVICAPRSEGIGEDGNESSAVVMVSTPKNRVLFTGDATSEIELQAAMEDIRCDVLKISHHGSGTSSEMAFLRKASPSLAVISVGRYNRFGHPHKEVLDRLNSLNVHVERTDCKGAVKIVFDTSTLAWYNYQRQAISS